MRRLLILGVLLFGALAPGQVVSRGCISPCATPTFDNGTGSYVSTVTVAIANGAATPSATRLYCTAVGADCTPASTYTVPLVITTTGTHLCAKAQQATYSDSSTPCAVYTITAPPSVVLTYRTGSLTSSSTVTVNSPVGVADGDLIVCTVMAVGSTTYPTISLAGWTSVATPADRLSTYYFRLMMFYKIAASEGASYTWTATNGNVGVYPRCMAYDNPNTSTPFTTGQSSSGYLAATATPTAATITTTQNNELLVLQFTELSGTVSYTGWSAPVTNERFDASGGGIADGVQATAGASGAKSATASGTGGYIYVMAAFHSQTP